MSTAPSLKSASTKILNYEPNWNCLSVNTTRIWPVCQVLRSKRLYVTTILHRLVLTSQNVTPMLFMSQLFPASTMCNSAFNITDSTKQSLGQKLTVAQPINKSVFNWTRRFTTVFTRARHWSLTWAKRIQSISLHPISLHKH